MKTIPTLIAAILTSLALNTGPATATDLHPVSAETEISEHLADRLIVPIEEIHTYKTNDLTEITDDQGRIGYLVPEAAAMFTAMQKEAALYGVSIRIASAWRSWELQNRAYEQWLATGTNLAGNEVPSMAHPDTSNHPKGLAIDIATSPETLRWLSTHGPLHGWWPITTEEWHWEYRGAPATKVASLTIGTHAG